jgi:Ni,Fe-hydrogenase maturation factor
MKLDCIKNRNSKVYALDASQSFSELKAAATLYQIPEFSVPEVNFEVSEQIRKKVDEAKREIISYFP